MTEKFEKEYSDALCRLIRETELLPSSGNRSGVNEAAAKMCGILRISEFKAERHGAADGKNVSGKDGSCTVLFSDGKPDEKRCFSIKRTFGDGSIAEYTACQYAEDPVSWTEEELDRVDAFVKTVFIFNDRERDKDIAEKLVYYDSEMGVRNANYFMKKCSELVLSGEIYGLCCCRFGLKRFSIINKRFGRAGGTSVMRKYIHGLEALLDEKSIVCRLGSDNFIALFPKSSTDIVMNYLIGTVVSTDGGEKVTVSARAGYFPVPGDCISAEEIIDGASAAESTAKSNPNLPFVFFDDEARERSENIKWIESLFADAVRNEEFLVYYQPKVNLKDYTLSGAEALCRWKHGGELISPSGFIPIFEQSNNICVLDFYMLEHICRDMRRWLDNGLPMVKVSVNMSRVHLSNGNLANEIISIINRYGIPKKYLEIELTETTTDVDFAELKKIVAALRTEGISTSVDDFGVGYSSLNLIREMPWNVLKIDKSFLPDNADDNGRQKRIMLKYVIAMAQNLGLECIVEGVETIEQVALLKEIGCYRAQGFYFDKPLPISEFEERLKGNFGDNARRGKMA